jgi:predicted nucleotidyltransferase
MTETREEGAKGFGLAVYQQVLERFLALLEEHFGDRLISLVLYGSVARGEAREESDIDLLLILDRVSPNYHRRLDEILVVQARLEREGVYEAVSKVRGSPPYFSYLILAKEEADENRYIYLDMVEDAKLLFDRAGFFAKRLRAVRNRLEELGSMRVQLKDGTWYWDLKPDLKAGEAFVL